MRLQVRLIDQLESIDVVVRRDSKFALRRSLIVPDTDEQRDWVVAFGNAQRGEVPPG